MSAFEPEGRVALVSGGSRGIGRETVRSLAGAGVAVAINYRRDQAAAESIRDEVQSLGGRCLVVRADVARQEEVARMLDRVRASLGPVAILVNNAGIARSRPADEITESDWDEVMATNLKSTFLMTQAVLPDMRRAGWGRIINMSSAAVQLGGIIGPHYTASKAGMIGLTHAYAAMLAGEGVTVNAITPALIETDMIRGNPRARPDRIPVGRFGRVEEVAEVVLMLVRNGYMTGQTISVNGGLYMT